MEFLGRRVAMTAKSVRALAEQRMAAVGSSLSTAIIVRILEREPDLSQRELAGRMGVEAPTLVRHLDRLEADGVVVRERDTRDRRIVRLRLTPAGHRLNVALSAVSAATHEELTTVFTPDELAQFEAYLDRVKQHAETRQRDDRTPT